MHKHYAPLLNACGVHRSTAESSVESSADLRYGSGTCKRKVIRQACIALPRAVCAVGFVLGARVMRHIVQAVSLQWDAAVMLHCTTAGILSENIANRVCQHNKWPKNPTHPAISLNSPYTGNDGITWHCKSPHPQQPAVLHKTRGKKPPTPWHAHRPYPAVHATMVAAAAAPVPVLHMLIPHSCIWVEAILQARQQPPNTSLLALLSACQSTIHLGPVSQHSTVRNAHQCCCCCCSLVSKHWSSPRLPRIHQTLDCTRNVTAGTQLPWPKVLIRLLTAQVHAVCCHVRVSATPGFELF